MVTVTPKRPCCFAPRASLEPGALAERLCAFATATRVASLVLMLLFSLAQDTLAVKSGGLAEHAGKMRRHVCRQNPLPVKTSHFTCQLAYLPPAPVRRHRRSRCRHRLLYRPRCFRALRAHRFLRRRHNFSCPSPARATPLSTTRPSSSRVCSRAPSWRRTFGPSSARTASCSATSSTSSRGRRSNV